MAIHHDSPLMRFTSTLRDSILFIAIHRDSPRFIADLLRLTVTHCDSLPIHCRFTAIQRDTVS